MTLLKIISGLIGALVALALVEDLSREPWVLVALVIAVIGLVIRRRLKNRVAPASRADEIDPRYRV